MVHRPNKLLCVIERGTRRTFLGGSDGANYPVHCLFYKQEALAGAIGSVIHAKPESPLLQKIGLSPHLQIETNDFE